MARIRKNIFYSIVRVEEQTYAQRKAERYSNSALNHAAKSEDYYKASHEGSDFLSLGEPIKVGHHSEGRHRALIERNRRRMDNSMESAEKAEAAAHKAEYWESKAEEITLAMPESFEYFSEKLEQATAYHAGLKNGTIEKMALLFVDLCKKRGKRAKEESRNCKAVMGRCGRGKR